MYNFNLAERKPGFVTRGSAIFKEQFENIYSLCPCHQQSCGYLLLYFWQTSQPQDVACMSVEKPLLATVIDLSGDRLLWVFLETEIMQVSVARTAWILFSFSRVHVATWRTKQWYGWSLKPHAMSMLFCPYNNLHYRITLNWRDTTSSFISNSRTICWKRFANGPSFLTSIYH